jgi:hypothetical protein
LGWNTQFDVQWLLAYDLHDLVFKLRWLDGMLLWRHWFIEPEYEMSRPNKKSYGLKTAVEEVLPKFAGYEEDIDFHSTDPAERAKLHQYNVRDVLFTLRIAKLFYNKLAEYPQRLKAALIEAECIPMIAEANLTGQMVDPLHTGDLQAKLIKDAEVCARSAGAARCHREGGQIAEAAERAHVRRVEAPSPEGEHQQEDR